MEPSDAHVRKFSFQRMRARQRVRRHRCFLNTTPLEVGPNAISVIIQLHTTFCRFGGAVTYA